MRELKFANDSSLKLLDMDEASAVLGIQKSTLYDLTMRKQITFVKIGKLNKFRMSDLQDFISKCIIERAN